MYTIFKNSVRVLVKYLQVVKIQLSVVSLVYYQGKRIPKTMYLIGDKYCRPSLECHFIVYGVINQLRINWWINGMSLWPKQLYSPFSLFVTTRDTKRSLTQLKAISKLISQNTMINLSDAFLFYTNQNTTLSSTWLVSEKAVAMVGNIIE